MPKVHLIMINDWLGSLARLPAGSPPARSSSRTDVRVNISAAAASYPTNCLSVQALTSLTKRLTILCKQHEIVVYETHFRAFIRVCCWYSASLNCLHAKQSLQSMTKLTFLVKSIFLHSFKYSNAHDFKRTAKGRMSSHANCWFGSSDFILFSFLFSSDSTD